jgi:prepilin-type N-terminal cleavage/methylation domain-containing protein
MRVKSQERRVKSQKCRLALRSSSGSRLLTLDSRLQRRGFTLIELLIVIMIITILAGLVLGVAAVAAETARRSKTQHVVERLHTLLMEHYETYKTRRALSNNDARIPSGLPGQVNAAIRLTAMRQLLRMEIPDRWSDVIGDDANGKSADQLIKKYPPGLLLSKYPGYILPLANNTTTTMDRTALSTVFLRRYAALKTTDSAIIRENQGAECLYMIVTLACGDGEARSLFAEGSIGDTDGDGAPEFLDGWGNPITFIRWPFGYQSSSTLITGNHTDDHDPFDPFRVHPSAGDPPQGARLMPLIASAGQDGLFDLLTDTSDGFVYSYPNAYVTAPFVVRGTTYNVPILNPYTNVASSGSTSYQMGDEIDTDNLGYGANGNGEMNNSDNVNNHLLGLR